MKNTTETSLKNLQQSQNMEEKKTENCASKNKAEGRKLDEKKKKTNTRKVESQYPLQQQNHHTAAGKVIICSLYTIF